MCNWCCGVTVNARDEEKVIEECLRSLRNQTLNLFVVVVNDGSADRTREVALKYADVVVDLPRHEESWTGRPELARVINAGFHILRRERVAYLMISGADAVYPQNYVEEIITRMKKENIVLASGIAENEVSRSLSPRGCGRVIDVKWFRSVGFKYPENYGFETYLVYKALSQGRKVALFQDLKFKLLRETRLLKRKLFLWGKGMRALNYWWPYALGRALLTGLKNPIGGYWMWRGYLSKVSLYEDIKRFTPNLQKKIFFERLKEALF